MNMKYICLTLCIIFVWMPVYGQYEDDGDRGALQISFGYIPSQKLSVSDKSNAITFDITGWPIFGSTGGDEDAFHCLFGLGAGLGIRSYRKIPTDALLNTDDPYQTSATRFDVHLGPGIGFGYGNAIHCFFSPQFGLWYAGMSNGGPKVNGTIAISGDLMIYMLSFGVTYRMSSPRLVSTNWNIDNPENAYILIKPALEFRMGVFF
ncbi:MAG: hypothetical protein LBN98_04520 [Prevotellaceae bacterium]|jgi:hypothetical protein|nr:hypothetical protein [Prevotellaceae bacterium]